MVLRHNKRPSSNEEPCRHAYKHVRQLECGDMLAPSEHAPHGLLFSGPKTKDNCPSLYVASPVFESSFLFSSFNQESEVSEGDHKYTRPNGTSSPSKVTNNTVGAVRVDNMECLERSSRHEDGPQKTERSPKKHLFVDNNLMFIEKERPMSPVPVEDELEKKIFDVCNELPAAGLHDYPPWFEGISSEDGGDLEGFEFPAYVKDDLDMPTVRQFEDIRPPVFEYPYRKLVAIGPNHQANIPACEQDHDDNSTRWLGTCLMPMRDCSELVSEVNHGCREHCGCSDRGSIRCVRQHVVEARERLKATLGQDTFRHLGFCDMGEDVAEKWSEEERRLFEEVVMSNPASLMRNFWDYLPQYFPTRSCKELVSYYFNVFMLCKRALQNRFDPLHVDSDNDEWQVSDDGESEDEDSIVESPCNEDDVSGRHDGHMSESECSFGGDSISDEPKRDLCDVAPYIYAHGKNLQERAGDHDIHDDSCTSFEGQQHAGESTGGPTGLQEPRYGLPRESNDMDGERKNDGLSGLNESAYGVGPCDMKSWDASYPCRSNKEEDFLPTCNVIEEVFGKAWDGNAEGPRC